MQAVSKPRGVTPRMKEAKGGETGGDGQGAPGRARGGESRSQHLSLSSDCFTRDVGSDARAVQDSMTSSMPGN